jgi:hypothetical protein
MPGRQALHPVAHLEDKEDSVIRPQQTASFLATRTRLHARDAKRAMSLVIEAKAGIALLMPG